MRVRWVARRLCWGRYSRCLVWWFQPPLSVGGDDEESEVDQVVASGAVAAQVGHVGASADRPGDHVVDLQVGPVAAGVETDPVLLDQDRLALFEGREP